MVDGYFGTLGSPFTHLNAAGGTAAVSGTALGSGAEQVVSRTAPDTGDIVGFTYAKDAVRAPSTDDCDGHIDGLPDTDPASIAETKSKGTRIGIGYDAASLANLTADGWKLVDNAIESATGAPLDYLYLDLQHDGDDTVTATLGELRIHAHEEQQFPNGQTTFTAAVDELVNVQLYGYTSISYNGGWFELDDFTITFDPASSAAPPVWDIGRPNPSTNAVVHQPLGESSIYSTSVGFGGPEGAIVDDVRVADPLKAKVTLPVGDDGGDRPAIVLVHGGSFSVGSEGTMDDWANELATRGYAVMAVDYRKLWQAAFIPRFAPNSHQIYTAGVTPTVQNVSIDFDGDVGTTTDAVNNIAIDLSDPPDAIEADINAALATMPTPNGVTVDVWGDAATNALFLMWLPADRDAAAGPVDPYPYPKLVTPATTAPVASGVFAVRSFTKLAEQLAASPTCNAPRAYGFGCEGDQRLDRQKCAADTGEAAASDERRARYPSASDLCDHGYRLWSQSTVRVSLDDVQSSVRWLKANADAYGIDPTKVFATGESAGAILSLELALRPEDPTGGAEEENGPNSGTHDATIAGAVPFAAGWMLNGMPERVNEPAPPIAILQKDWDGMEWRGSLQMFTRDILTTGWGLPRDLATTPPTDPLSVATENRVEYHGWCGAGHGSGALALLPQEQGTMLVDDVAKFFDTIINPDSLYGTAGGLGDDDGGVWLSHTGSGLSLDYVERPRQQLIGPSTAGEYTTLVGNFDGAGGDDLYFHHPTGECDSLWLGQPDGTFNPTPKISDTSFLGFPASAPGYSSPLGAIVDDPDDSGGSLDNAKPLIGDFDGDGADDIFWFRAGSSTHVIWRTRNPIPGGTFSDLMVDGPTEVFDTITVDSGSSYTDAFAGNFGIGPNGGTGDDIFFLDATSGDTGNTDDPDDKLVYFRASGSTIAYDALALVDGDGFNKNLNGTAGGLKVAVGNFDGDPPNEDPYDDILFMIRGVNPDKRFYGLANDSPTTAAGAFDRRDWNPINDVQHLIVGNFGTGNVSACTECDDIYLFDRLSNPSLAGRDNIYYGRTSRNLLYLELGDQFAPTDSSTMLYAVGDFDADGFDDIVYYGPDTGIDRIDYGASNSPPTADGAFLESTNLERTGDLLPLAGDFDGNGRNDVYWFSKR
jgi:acetyl esterase/lipase